MSNLSNIDQSISLRISRPSAAQRASKALLAVLPWAIIAGLLWAGLFIKPQPVGGTVTPPALERRDHFYGLALTPAGDVWASGSNGKILAIAADGAIKRLAMETHSYLNKGEGDARTTGAAVIDFQRNHATVSLIDTATWKTNFDAKASDFSLQALQKAGR
ncbi:hypothetical protein JF55_21215 [Pseudomonas sp. 1-7]|nr:hypothetical protein JF55_21215 [Pseudomonas sp. 1-7]